jgi:hypothetical protein
VSRQTGKLGPWEPIFRRKLKYGDQTTPGSVLGSLNGTASPGAINVTVTIPAATATGEIAFCDDFNRTNLEDTGQWDATPWTFPNGVTIASSTVLQSGAAGSDSGLFLEDLGSDDNWVELDVLTPGTDGGIMLLARCNVSTITHYGARYYVSTGDWEIFKRVTGTFTQLASIGSPDPSEPYRLRLEVQGTRVEIFEFSGGSWVSRLSTIDGSISAGHLVGVRLQASTGGGVANGDNFCCGAL